MIVVNSKEEATTEKNSVVRREGNRGISRNLLFYSLDAIIAVGYRVNSILATQFSTMGDRGVRLHFLPKSSKGRPALYQGIKFCELNEEATISKMETVYCPKAWISFKNVVSM